MNEQLLSILLKFVSWVASTSTQTQSAPWEWTEEKKNVIACVIEFCNEENRNQTSCNQCSNSEMVNFCSCLTTCEKESYTHIRIECFCFGELTYIFLGSDFKVVVPFICTEIHSMVEMREKFTFCKSHAPFSNRTTWMIGESILPLESASQRHFPFDLLFWTFLFHFTHKRVAQENVIQLIRCFVRIFCRKTQKTQCGEYWQLSK